MTDYRKEAGEDAKSAVIDFIDDIVDNIVQSEGAIDEVDINDYGDSYHHEHHVDRAYNLREAVDVLEELSEFEETDSGLWSGLEPREAIGAMAAYTYGNAVASMFRDILKSVNDEVETEEGETLFWTPEEALEKKAARTGVFDWMPSEKWEDLSDEAREEIEEKWEETLKAKVTEIVKNAVDKW